MKGKTLIARVLPAGEAKRMCTSCAQHGSGFGPVSQYIRQGVEAYAPGAAAYLRPQIEAYVKKHAEAALKGLTKKLTGSGLYVAGSRPRYYGSGLYVAGSRGRR